MIIGVVVIKAFAKALSASINLKACLQTFIKFCKVTVAFYSIDIILCSNSLSIPILPVSKL